jgi:hypothetical protein
MNQVPCFMRCRIFSGDQRCQCSRRTIYPCPPGTSIRRLSVGLTWVRKPLISPSESVRRIYPPLVEGSRPRAAAVGNCRSAAPASSSRTRSSTSTTTETETETPRTTPITIKTALSDPACHPLRTPICPMSTPLSMMFVPSQAGNSK